jgi:hypothetical protein
LSARLLLEYDGTDFAGWASQPGLRTVQTTVEEALVTVLRREVRLTVAGRTDRGVHARGQVASHDGEPAGMRNLNALLPADVAVLASESAPDGFDARRDALSRTYRYRVHTRTAPSPFERSRALWWPRPLDRDALDVEDVALAPAPLELACEQRLAELAPRAALGADLLGQQVARELLRDRRRALDDALRAVVRPRGAHDRLIVDALVRREPRILGGEHRLHEVARHHIERHERAVADRDALLERQLGEARAVGREDVRRAGGVRAPRGEVGHRRQIARPAAQRRDRDQRDDDRDRDQQPDHGEQRQLPVPAAVAPVRDDHAPHDVASNSVIWCGGPITRARGPSALAMSSAHAPVT